MEPKTPLEPQPKDPPQETPEGQAQPEEVETPEGQAQPEEVETPEASEGVAASPKEDPRAGHKRQGGYQRRIERLERQNQMLLEQLQRGGTAGAAPKEKTAEEKAAEQFETLVDRRIAQRDAQRAQREQLDTFVKRTAEARVKYEDFDDAISTLDIPTNSPLGQALLTSDHGPELMYQLANDPTQLARLNAMSPFAAVREIGKLEAKLGGAAPAKPVSGSAPAKRPPAPPSAVGGSALATPKDLSILPISEYKRAMRGKK